MNSKNIISMSVYGTKPMYLKGAIANARLLPRIYPGWTLRVYCCVAEMNVKPLHDLGCEVIPKPRSRLHSGMFWRFLAAWDPGVDCVLMRDADSRINVREAAAVRAWEESGRIAHCMMDHPHHSLLPMSGGMWAIRSGNLPRELLKELQQLCMRRQRRVQDMYWLRDRVHPLIQHSLLRHSSVHTRWRYVPFPSHEPYDGFVGQQYNVHGRPIWPETSKRRCGT